jgi:4-diphosphocytidyl-2-C-methyl-D-erythritol kinase
MNVIKLKSPAKLNLYLRVINKRPDGYHDIETIFERIDIFDEIKLKRRKDSKIRVVCNHPDVPEDSRNLAFKAVKVLQKDFRGTGGIDIIIKKRIPVAAGLGGGSSNAASVLLGLNRLWQLKLGKNQLLDYASRIGSDVPFFVIDKSFALGKGRGEKIIPLDKIGKFWHIVVIPPLKLYSKDIYSGLSLRLTKSRDNVNIITYALRNSDLSLLSKYIFNTLEYRVLRDYPVISKIKERLESLGVNTLLLSGSGPAVFGLIDSRKEGESLRSKLKKCKGWQVFVVRTL